MWPRDRIRRAIQYLRGCTAATADSRGCQATTPPSSVRIAEICASSALRRRSISRRVGFLYSWGDKPTASTPPTADTRGCIAATADTTSAPTTSAAPLERSHAVGLGEHLRTHSIRIAVHGYLGQAGGGRPF